MNALEFKITDVLSRRLGDAMSISDITEDMCKMYGRAHYADVHEKIREMGNQRIVKLSKSGRSVRISINFNHGIITDILAEKELRRKQNFLRNRHEMQMLLHNIDRMLRDVPLVSHMLLMHPENNARLNRAEIIISLKKSHRKYAYSEARMTIHKIINNMQKHYNIKVGHMTLKSETFLGLISSGENNPVKNMLHDKIVVTNPQDFWLVIKNAIETGTKISSLPHEDGQARISEKDLIFNLARFGYGELGSKVEEGIPFCMERVISSIILQGDARRVGAVSIIIAKNPKKSYEPLIFLAKKYGFAGKILGIMRVLNSMNIQGIKTRDEAIQLLRSSGIKEEKVDKKSIKERLKLYNVT